ncbi:hypothetical protein XENOCAPTIV_006196 [Xenoophorus captivus]|uniref:Uncharacterized protein n=1 Tax=Xenoophorus captivus TaxID=1517983 RepID=A0ABV0QYR8_9TELE
MRCVAFLPITENFKPPSCSGLEEALYDKNEPNNISVRCKSVLITESSMQDGDVFSHVYCCLLEQDNTFSGKSTNYKISVQMTVPLKLSILFVYKRIQGWCVHRFAPKVKT